MTILNNNNRITFGSFLAYFIMSAIISPLGVISGPVAEHFQISLTAANASFSYLTSGVFIGTLIAVFIFDYVKLRQIVIGGAATICLSLYAIYAMDNFQIFKTDKMRFHVVSVITLEIYRRNPRMTYRYPYPRSFGLRIHHDG